MGRLSDFLRLLSGTQAPTDASAVASPLDYDKMHLLDAEDLAEGGIGAAYRQLEPALRTWVATPKPILEHIDEDTPSYSVSAGAAKYEIYTPGTPTSVGWGRATFALFDIVNSHLHGAPVRFYAINAGNDLGGMFLTPEQVQLAAAAITAPTDWPYLPVNQEPWFGQHH